MAWAYRCRCLLLLLPLTAALAACATASPLAGVPNTSQIIAEEATAEKYSREAGTRGLVLFDVYWNRVWKCGQFENAQLRNLGFEKAPLTDQATDASSELLLTTPSELAPPRNFVPYAILVQPGEYHLTSFTIRAAKSVSEVGAVAGVRSQLVKDGASQVGSFRVAAGETIYIGNFGIDCLEQPIPWRYYTEGRKNFDEHLAEYKAKYPFVEPSQVIYRLFATTAFGRAYQLE